MVLGMWPGISHLKKFDVVFAQHVVHHCSGIRLIEENMIGQRFHLELWILRQIQS